MTAENVFLDLGNHLAAQFGIDFILQNGGHVLASRSVGRLTLILAVCINTQ